MEAVRKALQDDLEHIDQLSKEAHTEAGQADRAIQKAKVDLLIGQIKEKDRVKRFAVFHTKRNTYVSLREYFPSAKVVRAGVRIPVYM